MCYTAIKYFNLYLLAWKYVHDVLSEKKSSLVNYIILLLRYIE